MKQVHFVRKRLSSSHDGGSGFGYQKRTLNTSYLYGNFCGICCLHKSPEADFLKSIADNGRGFWKNWKWFSVFPPTQLVTLKSSKLIQLLLLLHQVLSLCIQTAMMQELDMSLYVVFGTGAFFSLWDFGIFSKLNKFKAYLQLTPAIFCVSILSSSELYS